MPVGYSSFDTHSSYNNTHIAYRTYNHIFCECVRLSVLTKVNSYNSRNQLLLQQPGVFSLEPLLTSGAISIAGLPSKKPSGFSVKPVCSTWLQD